MRVREHFFASDPKNVFLCPVRASRIDREKKKKKKKEKKKATKKKVALIRFPPPPPPKLDTDIIQM